MKEDKVVYLVDIRDELQSFMKYDDGGNAEFEHGYESWKTWCVRNGFVTAMFFTHVEKRQWLSKFAALSLCYYLNAAHFWKCLRQ